MSLSNKASTSRRCSKGAGRRPRRGHAPVGQVGPQLRRVRRRRGARRARRRRRRRGTTSQFVAGADTDPQRLSRATSPAPRSPRRSAGTAPGWRVVRAPAPRAPPALDTARAQILAGLCDVALVVGADTTPEGLPRPERAATAATIPTGCASACSARPTRPTSRSTPAGAWSSTAPPTPTSPRCKVKNAAHGAAQPQRPLPQGGHRGRGAGLADGGRPAAPARDLRHLRRRRGRRARRSMDYARRARRRRPGARRGDLDRDADVSPTPSSRCRTSPPTPAAALAPPELHVPRLDRRTPPTRRPASAPTSCRLAEVYDLSTALELDWYENIGLCKPGEAEQLLQRRRHRRSAAASRSTRAAGSPASARPSPPRRIAQVCELTWQLRGQAGGRQVEGATVGITVNQGLFGHGSAVLLTGCTDRSPSSGSARSFDPEGEHWTELTARFVLRKSQMCEVFGSMMGNPQSSSVMRSA